MNKKIKIYIYYNITNKPWGGGNSFLKAFRKYILNHRNDEFEIVDNITEDYDIFFMNGGHKDQGVYIDLKEIKKYTHKQDILDKFFKKKKVKLIYRLDGARIKYGGIKTEMDELQYKALLLSDYVIFQSHECLDSFRHFGYKSSNYKIIYNGVDQDMFNSKDKKYWDGRSKLKVLSVNWSANIHKGYKVIAKLSKLNDVESTFVGNWNEDVETENVQIHPPVQQEDLAKYYKEADVFLHAAEHDPCPNVVLEAMSSGLPIIYHNSGGTKEIAKNFGVSLPDTITSETLRETIKKIKHNYLRITEELNHHKEEFSIKTVADKYLETFIQVLHGTGR